jgi:lysophospholipase L1-like esterase
MSSPQLTHRLTNRPALLALLTSVAFCLFPGAAQGASVHSATDPVPRPDEGWKTRQKLLNQRAADGGRSAEVIFIGDSITQGWEGEGKAVWERYYAPRKAINLGIGGDRTQHVLWRLDNGNLDGLAPRAAVVMIGTNNSNGDDNSVAQIADGVAAIVAKLRAKLPQTKILLLGIFPRSENPSNQRGKLLQVNQILRRLADGQWVHWLDIGHLFVTEQGLIPRDLMPDYLHLSPKGYSLWADSIEEKLTSLMGGQTAGDAVNSPAQTLAGEWIWKIQGPDGNPVEAPLILAVQGSQITGKFARGNTDRWLEIADGKLEGNRMSWTVKRDRPTGGELTYRMSGTLSDGKINGRVKTLLNGEEQDVEWSARRK